MEASAIPIVKRGTGNASGGGTQTSPCEVFLMFFLFDSIVSDGIEQDSKNYFGLAPFFSPPPGLRPGSGLSGRAPQLMIGGARGEEEEKEEEEENHTTSHSGSGTK